MRINTIWSYGEQFNPEVLKTLDKINNKIKEELEKEEPNSEELLKLEEAKMMEGMMMCGGYGFNNYRRNIPW